MNIEVRVQSRAKRNAIKPGTPGQSGEWKRYLTAPAVEGQANQALIEFFAKGLRISRSRVSIVSGEKSRHKVVALDGVTEEQFRQLIPTKKTG